jgi:AraC-like DNA-binding protein
LPSRFLAAALVGNSVVLLFWLQLATDSFRVFPESHALTRFFSWTLAPLLYFYLRTLLNADDRPNWWLVAAVLTVPGTARAIRDLIHGYDLEAIATYIDWAIEEGALPGAKAGTIIGFLRSGFQLVFAFLSWRLLYRAWHHARSSSIELPRTQLWWLGSLGLVITAYNISHIQGNFASLNGYWLPLSSAYGSSLLRCLLVQIVAVAALLVPEALDRNAGEMGLAKRRPPIDEAEARKLVQRLVELMDSVAPHRDPKLRVAKLASELDLSSHMLSQLLTEALSTNFADFVNGYRVRDAQRLLQSEHATTYTLSAIGEEAGFASRASFNRVFKNLTGETPSAYRDGDRHPESSPIPMGSPTMAER